MWRKGSFHLHVGVDKILIKDHVFKVKSKAESLRDMRYEPAMNGGTQ